MVSKSEGARRAVGDKPSLLPLVQQKQQQQQSLNSICDCAFTPPSSSSAP